jgi:phytoene/squalene synthetase
MRHKIYRTNAIIAVDAAVQLQNLLAAGQLMQAVNILRDNSM